MGTLLTILLSRRRVCRRHLQARSNARSVLLKKKIGSSNRRKAVKKVGCYDRKISDIRNDFSHKTSYTLADAPVSLLVFEGLPIKNMTASAKGTVEEPG